MPDYSVSTTILVELLHSIAVEFDSLSPVVSEWLPLPQAQDKKRYAVTNQRKYSYSFDGMCHVNGRGKLHFYEEGATTARSCGTLNALSWNCVTQGHAIKVTRGDKKSGFRYELLRKRMRTRFICFGLALSGRTG